MARKRVSRKAWKAEGKSGRYRRYARRGKGRIDKRSIRTIRVGRHGKLMRVGCPKGSWSPKYKRCRKGMRAYSLMVPVGKNPGLNLIEKPLVFGGGTRIIIVDGKTQRAQFGGHSSRDTVTYKMLSGPHLFEIGVMPIPVTYAAYDAHGKTVTVGRKVAIAKNPQKMKKSWVDANERGARLRIGMSHLGSADIAFIKGPKQYARGLTPSESERFHELDQKRLKLSRIPEGSLWRETKGDVDKIVAWFRKHGFPQQAETLLQWRTEGKLPK